ncbi:hypothetical protein K432DRAFT_20178 [Lepidopterella palustris CBS 459.81]|uniref:Uncharacterized protein n=1 Tax=Lepidopterella palustris CBS 459.81 TaxID=1314670 RepID=A0A8E2ECP1_9PEZI|nr:hypothetical protein K432DRAFT_20178 [Lepidopterella palustris CBS 459.81]
MICPRSTPGFSWQSFSSHGWLLSWRNTHGSLLIVPSCVWMIHLSSAVGTVQTPRLERSCRCGWSPSFGARERAWTLGTWKGAHAAGPSRWPLAAPLFNSAPRAKGGAMKLDLGSQSSVRPVPSSEHRDFSRCVSPTLPSCHVQGRR